MADTDKMLKAALDLAEKGVSVHFLKKRSKAPIEDSWSTAPTNDAERLERTYRPGYNIGIRLGKFSESNGKFLHVIDMDVRKPGGEKAALAELKR